MAADHEITLPPDVVLDAGQNYGTPEYVSAATGIVPTADLPHPFTPPIAEYLPTAIGDNNGGGGGGVCEDERPDTGMLYPRG